MRKNQTLVLQLLLIILLCFSNKANGQKQLVLKKEKNKFGILNNDSWILPPKYDSIILSWNRPIAVLKKDKWGIFNDQGKNILPCKFKKVSTKVRGVILAQSYKSGLWNIYDINGNISIDKEFFDANPIHENLFITEDPNTNKLSLWNNNMKLVYENFDRADTAGNWILITMEKSYEETHTKKGFIFNKSYTETVVYKTCIIIQNQGEQITPEFDLNGKILHEKTIIFSTLNQKFAILDFKNNKISDWFDKISNYGTDQFYIKENVNAGLLDNHFNYILKPQYDTILKGDDYYLLNKDKKWWLADINGELISTPLYSIDPIGQHYFQVRVRENDSVYYTMNKKGDISSNSFGFIFPFNDNFSRVINKDNVSQYAYINTKGEIISPWFDREKIYDSGSSRSNRLKNLIKGVTGIGILESFGNFLRGRKNNNKNKEGDGYEYFYGSEFIEGKAIVSVKSNIANSYNPYNNEYVLKGLIDTTGKYIIQPLYPVFDQITSHYFTASDKNGTGLFNAEGKKLLDLKYKSIKYLKNDCFEVEQDFLKNYLYTLKNNSLTKASKSYHHISTLENCDLFLVETYSKYGLIDSNGREIIPVEYNKISPFKDGIAKMIKVINGTEITVWIDKQGNIISK